MKLFDKFKDDLIYAFSTRQGGVSEGCYSSLNLSFSLNDDPEKVRQNHEIWCNSLGVDPHATVMLSQIHSAVVIPVDRSDCGCGLFRDRIPDTDGMVTNVPGVALVTGHADCVPVYLYDPVKRAIGLCHAGWRGTTAEIARVTVEKLQQEYGSDPKDLYAMIGPCISMQYFECDLDVIDEVERMSCDTYLTYYYNEFTGKYHVSLSELNRQVLKKAGVPASHIDMEDVCTYAHPELYYSHRRDGKLRGGMQAMLMLKPQHSEFDQGSVPGDNLCTGSETKFASESSLLVEDERSGVPDLPEFKRMLSELLDELPQAFFKELSGGVVVSESAKLAPEARVNDLYILGTYSSGRLGRQVTIYYGSFKLLFSNFGADKIKERLRATVRHEFRHHMEFLAGMHGADSLKAEDKRQMREYLNL